MRHELAFHPARFRGHLAEHELATGERTELARAVVTALVRSGAVLDTTRLTNAAFHLHHPDRDLRRRIDPVAEPALAAEWKHLRSTVVLPALAPAAPATPAAGPRGVRASTGTILLVGDSHTDGAFGTELASLLGHSGSRVLRHAKVGSAVGYWLPLVPALLRAHAPSMVIIALGANMRHGYPTDVGRSRQIRKLVDVVRREAPGARLFWIGPPRERADTEATLQHFNGIVRAGLDAGTTFIDSGPHAPTYQGSDGVHYTNAAARAWAHGVFTQLR